MQEAAVPLLLLCGAPGTGKSSVAWEVYWLLMRRGVPVAHIDLDGIGYGPPGQSGSFDLKFANLAALWPSYAEVGASALVVSGLRRLQKDVLACGAAVPGFCSDSGCSNSHGRGAARAHPHASEHPLRPGARGWLVRTDT